MSTRLASLDAIHRACWQQLALATHARGHGWRRLALATVAQDLAHADGPPQADAPTAVANVPTAVADVRTVVADVRTVVLREVDADARLLVFYTDSRARKVAQIRAQPQATLLAWCPSLGWQLRLRARLAVDTGGLAVSSRWAQLKMHPAAQDYLSPLPPGTALPVQHGTATPPPDGGAPPPPPEAAPPHDGHAPDRSSREHFAVVFATVEQIDWLELHPEGHRRAGFSAEGRGLWLTP